MRMRLTGEDRRYLAEASAEGLDVEHVKALFADAFQARSEQAESLWRLRCDALAYLRISKSHRAFRRGDANDIYGLDVAASDLSGHALLGPTGDAERLFDILSLHEEDYRPNRAECWREALSYARRLRRRGDVYYATLATDNSSDNSF